MKCLLTFGLLVSMAVLTCTDARAQAPGVTLKPNPNYRLKVAGSPSEQDKFLANPRWKATVEGLKTWASTQNIYDDAQVAKIREQLEARARQLSAPEFEKMMDDWEKWLAVATSPEAQAANAYLNQTLALESDKARAKTRSRLPDVVRLTPAELEQELLKFEAQQQSRAATKAAFDQSRALQIQASQQSLAAQQMAQQQARNQAYRTAATRPSYQSPLSPPAPVQRYSQQPSTQFYFGTGGRTGIVYGGHRW